MRYTIKVRKTGTFNIRRISTLYKNRKSAQAILDGIIEDYPEIIAYVDVY